MLIEAENVISSMKDGETGQRGYLLTLDPQFLQPYTSSIGQVKNSYDRLLNLTRDNEVQQANLVKVKTLYNAKFAQMQRIIDRARQDDRFRGDYAQSTAGVAARQAIHGPVEGSY